MKIETKKRAMEHKIGAAKTTTTAKTETSYELTNGNAFFAANYEQSIKRKHTHIVVLQTEHICFNKVYRLKGQVKK